MWDERYREPDYVYGRKPNDFLAAHASELPKGRVLCLAEGEGRNAVFLAKLGFDVHAIDFSEVGLAKATSLAAQEGVSVATEVADLGNVAFQAGHWNGIVSIFAHIPSASRRALHAQVVEALAPEGVFMLEAYTVRQLKTEGVGGPPEDQSDSFMSLAALREELRGLDFLHGVEIEREVNEGKFHRGQGAVVQVIARKAKAPRPVEDSVIPDKRT
ncbi:MAG: class I SAM-dependent methyltransferase [Chthoniobacterales bacterium]|nr:class I SAM-dependent methyltransferase [Chthoniobacterales bacterium]